MQQKGTVGLCLAGYIGSNYGMLLQAFATQQIIDRLGYKTEIIKYKSGKNKGIKPSVGAAYVAAKAVCSRIKEKIAPQKETMDAEHRANRDRRYKLAGEFRDRRWHSVVECYGIDELRELSTKYQSVLVGSDQLWQPDIAFTNFYTLRFAAPGVKRISYATSLGVSEYPKYCWRQAKDYWTQIDYISVREEQGADLIEKIAGIKPEVVADPTYLLTKEDWLSLIPDKTVSEEQYVLCYFLSDDKDAKALAIKYAHDRCLKCISILSSECNADDSDLDEVLTDKTPEDFINLIRHAECVFTDSFHGLAFSVINEKDFYIFYRKRTDVRASRNSRIDNILAKWGLEKRLVIRPEDGLQETEIIDYSDVHEKVDSIRKKSLQFLIDALDGEVKLG